MSSKVLAARERLLNYPVLLSKCNKESKSYASCIVQREEVKHGDCGKEFLNLISCLRKASAKLGSKI